MAAKAAKGQSLSVSEMEAPDASSPASTGPEGHGQSARRLSESGIARAAVKQAQVNADALLFKQFDSGGGDTFDYTSSVVDAVRGMAVSSAVELPNGHGNDRSTDSPASSAGSTFPGHSRISMDSSVVAPSRTSLDSEKNSALLMGPGPQPGADQGAVTAYLDRMQRGGLIQSFGCMMLLDEKSLRILAFSENTAEMLGYSKPEEAFLTNQMEAKPKKLGQRADSKRGVGSALRSLSSVIKQAISTHASMRARTLSGIRKKEASPQPAGTPALPNPSASPARPLPPSSEEAALKGGSLLKPWTMLRSIRRSLGTPKDSCLGTPADLLPPLDPAKPPSVELGASALMLFTEESAESIKRAVMAQDLSLVNPVLVQTLPPAKPPKAEKQGGEAAEQAAEGVGERPSSIDEGAEGAEDEEAEMARSFYAILHRSSDGVHLDLEPIREEDPLFTGEGAMQAHRLAAKGIKELQRVPTGHLQELCEVIVKEVRALTGYDRVMCYMFHEDEHGEVLAEERREDMEPYLGLHYPATDIPQAARFLFLKTRVRIISDCFAPPVRVVQNKKLLPEPVVLSNSTLRAVHGCHVAYMKNMGTQSTISLAVVVNDPSRDAAPNTDASRRLWGLVVCHHEASRYVPYPLRLACEFLMQVFSLKVNVELEMAAQEKEKKMLKTQTLLCDMLQRDAPLGIMNQYPNVTDLVKCDGAALLYGGKVWTLGTTPTEEQMQDMRTWLQEKHPNSGGLSTDSLKDCGYPGAEALGNAVCGMMAAPLVGSDYLFWFRGHMQKEVVWSGARHEPGAKDDGRKMNPRSSFEAFLEVVRHRSAPWDDLEIDAVISLAHILRGHLTAFSNKDLSAMEAARLADRDMERLSAAESDLSRVLETASAPVFRVDPMGCVTSWNAGMEQLTGLGAGDALGMSLVHDLAEGTSRHAVGWALALALKGDEAKSVEVCLRKFDPKAEGEADQKPGSGAHPGSVVLLMNAFVSRGKAPDGLGSKAKGAKEGGGSAELGAVTGVCFVGQDLTRQREAESHFTKMQGDYSAIVHGSSSLIPPIFAVDEMGQCAEWNPAMEKASGIKRHAALGRILVGDLFGAELRLRVDERTRLMMVLNRAIVGHSTKGHSLAFINAQGALVEALLSVSPRTDAEGKVLGAFCFLQIPSTELHAAMRLQRAAEDFAKLQARAVAYLRQEIRGPLDGLKFARSLMQKWPQAGEAGRAALDTSIRCEQQVTRLLGDDDVEALEEGFLGLESDEYRLEHVVETVASMGSGACARNGVVFRLEGAEELTQKRTLCGDATRLQQALSNFVGTASQFTPKGGWVCLRVVTGTRSLFVSDPNNLRCEFRVMHSGNVPASMVKQMYDCCSKNEMTQEGLCLSISRRIIQGMEGEVQYGKAFGYAEFVVRVALAYPRESSCSSSTLMRTYDASTAELEVTCI